MSYIILAILFILSGFFMKYSDDFFDENNNLLLASVFGVLCGVMSGVAAVNNVGAAYIFLAIIIGNFIALKIDGIHHILTLIVFIVIVLSGGLPEVSLAVLLICVLGALSDEIGHELIHTVSDNKFLNLFFEYRFVMKIVILLLAVCDALDIFVFILFILFEISYGVAGVVFKRLSEKNS